MLQHPSRTLRWVLSGLLLTIAARASGDYGYPISDPYAATVLGTPPEARAPVPDKIDVKVRSLKLFPDREIPGVFWNERKFYYSAALQKQRAPLIFLIAGTGARFDSSKLVYLQKALYQAGLSVVNISSPTQADFITNASSSSVPGYMKADVQDLYTAMRKVYADIERRVEVSEFYLSGYSLGATEAAFLGRHDEREGAFGFKKILLINPSVSLHTSVTLLDDMLARSVPGGVPELQRLIDDLYRKVSQYFHTHHRAPVDGELLYHAAQTEGIPRQELEAMIGVSFRISSATMLFTSDVMNDFGVIVGKGTKLGISTSTTPYMKMAARWTFADYMDEVLVPYWKAREPGLTRQELIDGDSLREIRGYLRRSNHIEVMTNQDDLILVPGDVEFLKETFGSRATIYPVGGHCGNIMYKENIEHMLAFFGAGQ